MKALYYDLRAKAMAKIQSAAEEVKQMEKVREASMANDVTAEVESLTQARKRLEKERFMWASKEYLLHGAIFVLPDSFHWLPVSAETNLDP